MQSHSFASNQITVCMHQHMDKSGPAFCNWLVLQFCRIACFLAKVYYDFFIWCLWWFLQHSIFFNLLNRSPALKRFHLWREIHSFTLSMEIKVIPPALRKGGEMPEVFFVVKDCIQGVRIQPLYLPIDTSAHQSQFVHLQEQKTSL